MMSMMGEGMILNMLIWIIVLGLIIYGIVLLIMKLGTQKADSPLFEKQGDSAIEILRERFARGEIDEQEFEKRKKFLGNK